jgi:outer membrane protein assembly factor BamB
MSRVRRKWDLAAAAAAMLALVVAGCEHGKKESAAEPAGQQVPARAAPAPPPVPQAAIRVIDGDTSKSVAGALVVSAGVRGTVDDGGMVRFDSPGRRVRARVSARGYEPRTVRVDFRGRLVQTVPIWRPALQWPMYGANPARTQVHPAIRLRPPFRVVWKRRLHGLVEFPAVVWDGVAYVNNGRGWLRALSMKNGHLMWRKRVGRLMASSPAVDPKRRILVTTSMVPGDVTILSMAHGRVRWRYHTGLAEPSPVVRNGIAYFGATNGNVYALDLDRRRPRWIFRGGAKITSSAALVGNRLYFGDYAGRVFALNARTGRVIWRGSAGTRVYGTVAVAGERVFVPSVFSGLSALSARSGRLLWRIPVGAYLYSSPAFFRHRVYFGTYAGRVYCAAARSGRILWSRPTGGRVSGAVQIVAGVLYAGTLEGRITAWHWRTGRTLWHFHHARYVPVSGNGARLLMHGGSGIWAVVPKRRKA